MLAQLILVPTPLELQTLATELPAVSEQTGVEVCGFGPVAAAARTAALLCQLRPQRVILVGIAGALDPCLEIGAAYQFDQVVCYGVGVGSGDRYQSAEELGWKQWAADPPVGDRLRLSHAAQLGALAAGPLLTACTGSADATDVAHRRQKFPTALAEDMEGFGVALACHLANTPLQIIRGISNLAGQRDKQQWQIAPALRVAGQLVRRVVEHS